MRSVRDGEERDFRGLKSCNWRRERAGESVKHFWAKAEIRGKNPTLMIKNRAGRRPRQTRAPLLVSRRTCAHIQRGRLRLRKLRKARNFCITHNGHTQRSGRKCTGTGSQQNPHQLTAAVASHLLRGPSERLQVKRVAPNALVHIRELAGASFDYIRGPATETDEHEFGLC